MSSHAYVALFKSGWSLIYLQRVYTDRILCGDGTVYLQFLSRVTISLTNSLLITVRYATVMCVFFWAYMCQIDLSKSMPVKRPGLRVSRFFVHVNTGIKVYLYYKYRSLSVALLWISVKCVFYSESNSDVSTLCVIHWLGKIQWWSGQST